MGVRNTTGSRSNPKVTEWGSKARKEQAKAKRKTARDTAIAEGLLDDIRDTRLPSEKKAMGQGQTLRPRVLVRTP